MRAIRFRNGTQKPLRDFPFDLPSNSTDLVLEQYEREDLEADVDAEELERQVQREVDEGEARVVGQGEAEGRLQGRRQYLDLDARLGRHGDRRAQQPHDPGLDLAHVVLHDRGGAVERLAAQH